MDSTSSIAYTAKHHEIALQPVEDDVLRDAGVDLLLRDVQARRWIVASEERSST